MGVLGGTENGTWGARIKILGHLAILFFWSFSHWNSHWSRNFFTTMGRSWATEETKYVLRQVKQWEQLGHWEHAQSDIKNYSGIDIICHLQGYLQRIQRPDKGTMWSRAKSDVSCSGYVAPVAFWSPDKQTTMTTYFSDMKMNTWSECTRKMIDSEYDRREEKKKNCFYTWTKKYW